MTVGLPVACALFLGGVLSDLPQATLGCLVIVAVIGLIKPAEFVRFWQLSRLEFWVATVTAAAGLCFGLLVAVLVGVLLTLFLIIRELAHVQLTELEPDAEGDLRIADAAHTHPLPGLLVLRFEGPVYAANVRAVNRRVIAALDAHQSIDVLLLDGTALGEFPLAVLTEFAQLQRDLNERNVSLWFSSLPPAALELARQLPHWSEFEEEDRAFVSTAAAVHAFASQRREDDRDREPDGDE